jgi:putative hydrolase of the HAD superfamily
MVNIVRRKLSRSFLVHLAWLALPVPCASVILIRMRRSVIQTVVFDAVGTLIYPEPGVAAVYAAVGGRFGSKFSQWEVEHRFRQVFQDEEARACMGDARTSEPIECERWRRIVQHVLSDAQDPDACFTELYAHFARPGSWSEFSDVPEALANLRSAGIQIGVASNFDGRLFNILRSIESTRQIDFALASSEIGFRKPHRGFFDAIVARAGVERAGILYIGDDPANDVAAARAAGLRAQLVDRRMGSGLLFSLLAGSPER